MKRNVIRRSARSAKRAVKKRAVRQRGPFDVDKLEVDTNELIDFINKYLDISKKNRDSLTEQLKEVEKISRIEMIISQIRIHNAQSGDLLVRINNLEKKIQEYILYRKDIDLNKVYKNFYLSVISWVGNKESLTSGLLDSIYHAMRESNILITESLTEYQEETLQQSLKTLTDHIGMLEKDNEEWNSLV